MQTLEYTIPSISCGHCKKTIETSLGGLPGVSDVEVAVPEKKVSLSFDPAQVSEDRIRETLDEEGYTPQ